MVQIEQIGVAESERRLVRRHSHRNRKRVGDCRPIIVARMRALVTGAAGFVGSTLADHLIAAGDTVIGVDNLSAYYDPEIKRSNLRSAAESPSFEFVEADLSSVELAPLLDGVDVVFHQAAQPGVRLSWADGFGEYVAANIELTQRLLEVCRSSDPSRFVYASSSSVYGQAARYPVREPDPTVPFSPYGVTKLAAEHLCRAYAANFGVPTVALRYFTVYGPRQRPDMATHRLIEAARRGDSFPLFGDGSQIRDFTYVGDVVRANLLAARADVEPGSVFNVCGGGATRLLDLVQLVGDTVGREVKIDWRPAEPGDVAQTGGDDGLIRSVLGWSPTTRLEDGVARQVEWHSTALPMTST